jgi:hypothetical protein
MMTWRRSVNGGACRSRSSTTGSAPPATGLDRRGDTLDRDLTVTRWRTGSGPTAKPVRAGAAWTRRYPYLPSEVVNKWVINTFSSSRRGAVVSRGRDAQS